jgi:murein DD-endopeptidase MepM/ murein hydrolase activator NlpD
MIGYGSMLMEGVVGVVALVAATSLFPGDYFAINTQQRTDAQKAAYVRLVGEHAGFEGYGKIVLVDVGGGYETLYAHLSRAGVRPGEEVDADQPLGIAGCTGWCTGTHLHFEVRLRGRAVNPLRFPFRESRSAP